MDSLDKAQVIWASVFFLFVVAIVGGGMYAEQQKREQEHRHEMDRLKCKEPADV